MTSLGMRKAFRISWLEFRVPKAASPPLRDSSFELLDSVNHPRRVTVPSPRVVGDDGVGGVPRAIQAKAGTMKK